MNLKSFKEELNNSGNKEKAKLLSGFFKTGKGEYGEGDIFLGIIVPIQRKIAKKYELELEEIQELLNSGIHEYRLSALFVLIRKYERAVKNKQEQEMKKIVDFYLKNTKNINNWDLIDLSAPKIVGNYLIDKPRDILYKLAKSKSLWEKRISVLSCFTFIREKDFKDALKISEILLKDKHDLIHKAVGWMLREIGKKNSAVEEDFLEKNCKNMPRTMLRYAIEKFSESKRKYYLTKK